MRSFCLYCFAALTAGAVLVSHGVTDETPDPFGEAFDTDVASEAVVEVPAPRSEIDDLRAKYLNAAKQRAEMMDEDALREAVETEEKSVAELRARQALKKVEQELERIGDEYPGTTAGQHAVQLRKMLREIDINSRSGQRPLDTARDSGNGSYFDEDQSGFSRDPEPTEDRRSRKTELKLFDGGFEGT